MARVRAASIDSFPFVVRTFGLVPDDLLQSPAFPEGGTLTTAMRSIARSPEFTPGKPGESWILRGHVQVVAVNIIDPDDPVTWAVIGDAASQFTEAAVKLRVLRCKFPGATLIDSDRALVVEGGQPLEVQAWVPDAWRLYGEPPAFETPGVAHLVDLRMTLCRCDCAPPAAAQLTWWSTVDDGDAIVRPRRATRLQLLTPATAGLQAAWWDGVPNAPGSVQLSPDFAINGGFVNTDAIPAGASHLEIANGAAGGVLAMFAWTIES